MAEQLATTNVVKTYGKGSSAFSALRGITLSIKRGESVAILGKSGSGKSTLMHLLGALDSPTEGEVVVDGRALSSLERGTLNDIRNYAFGFIFQQFFLNARQTCLDNVALPLVIRGVKKSERQTRALAALRAVGLEDRAGQKANDLSGGQKQRVAIARALVIDPMVIFADEPTGNLDTETGKAVIDLLFRLNEERGITLIVVTHDDDLAKRCGRQFIMQDGRIVEERTHL